MIKTSFNIERYIYTYTLYNSLLILLKILQFYGLCRHPKFSKKTQQIVVFLLKKSIQPCKNWSFAWKSLSFFTQKDLPASRKTEILNEKMTKNWQKKVPKRAPSRSKTWSFAWKMENRPTTGDFEKKILDPQLHQIFKPIRKFFCTFLLI